MQAVVREGKRLRTVHLDVRLVASPRRYCRVGFIVPKYGNSSVERNRVKRLLRERTRHQLLGALNDSNGAESVDVVVRARPDAYRAPVASLQREFADLADRIARLLAPAAEARRDDTRPARDA